jgi:hypothetical protein
MLWRLREERAFSTDLTEQVPPGGTTAVSSDAFFPPTEPRGAPMSSSADVKFSELQIFRVLAYPLNPPPRLGASVRDLRLAPARSE